MIFLVAWMSLLLVFYVMKFLIFMPMRFPGQTGQVVLGEVRDVIGVAVAFLWLYSWKKIGEFYMWRRLGRRKG